MVAVEDFENADTLAEFCASYKGILRNDIKHVRVYCISLGDFEEHVVQDECKVAPDQGGGEGAATKPKTPKLMTSEAYSTSFARRERPLEVHIVGVYPGSPDARNTAEGSQQIKSKSEPTKSKGGIRRVVKVTDSQIKNELLEKKVIHIRSDWWQYPSDGDANEEIPCSYKVELLNFTSGAFELVVLDDWNEEDLSFIRNAYTGRLSKKGSRKLPAIYRIKLKPLLEHLDTRAMGPDDASGSSKQKFVADMALGKKSTTQEERASVTIQDPYSEILLAPFQLPGQIAELVVKGEAWLRESWLKSFPAQGLAVDVGVENEQQKDAPGLNVRNEQAGKQVKRKLSTELDLNNSAAVKKQKRGSSSGCKKTKARSTRDLESFPAGERVRAKHAGVEYDATVLSQISRASYQVAFESDEGFWERPCLREHIRRAQS
jgi:hypothetical protein